MTDGDVVEVRGLVKNYGSLRAVDGIDLTLRKGEVFSFLGPNGAGKTTTVEVLEGIRPKTSGDVRVLGRDPWKDRRALQARVGVIPQDFSFFEKITPREGLEFYAALFGTRVDPLALLRQVELEEKADAAFDKLSGGQKQKLGLALALVNDPQVLFLDEPTTGLDPQARRAVWGVIRKLRTEGRTILLTTHYLEEAQTLADRVAIIDHGKIIAEDTPSGLIQRYGRPPRVRVEGSRALADHLAQRWGHPVEYADGAVLAEVPGKEDVVQLLRLVTESGIPWGGVATVRDTLEDVFVRLVGHLDETGSAAKPAPPPSAVPGAPA